MKIITNGFELLESGVIDSIGLEPITFQLSASPLFEVELLVVFDGKDSGVSYEVEGGSKIVFKYSNPSGLSYGLATPFKIGTLNGREVYTTLRVDIHGENTSFALQYTFYLKDVK